MVRYKNQPLGEPAIYLNSAYEHEVKMKAIANTIRLAMTARDPLTEQDRDGIYHLAELLRDMLPDERHLQDGMEEISNDSLHENEVPNGYIHTMPSVIAPEDTLVVTHVGELEQKLPKRKQKYDKRSGL